MFDQTIKPRLTLVGAGPGDPDLITVRGLRALTDADVVLYDALANRALLKYVPSKAEKIFVGKRAGKHYASQDKINALIVEKALNRGHVVRLKGGDPFVFARGHEELEYASSLGIQVEVVPGISSAIAVPELQQIPLTRRGVSESFWVITGTTKQGQLSNDIPLAAQSSATIVILMGLRKLTKIAAIFSLAGKGSIPVAVISNGSLPQERIALGTVDTIVETVKEKELPGPAIIMIGETVKYHPEVPIGLLDKNRLQNLTLQN